MSPRALDMGSRMIVGITDHYRPPFDIEEKALGEGVEFIDFNSRNEDDFDEDEIKMENSESLENDAAHRNGSLQLQMPNFDSQYALPAVRSLRNADASDGGNNSTQTHEISVHPFIDPADNFTCMVCGQPSETEGCSIVRAQATWVFNALQQIYSDQQLQNLD